jgi:hypothetical protein
MINCWLIYFPFCLTKIAPQDGGHSVVFAMPVDMHGAVSVTLQII